jgi:Lrp/AsnC family transcriptional regulator
MVNMDAIDRRILLALQEDATIPLSELALKAGLSPTPCWKRVQKLEDAGVIEKRVALLNPAKVGLGLTVFVEIETSEHSSQWLNEFATKVKDMPEVMGLYRMAGDVDYLMQVVVRDMADYDAFYKRLVAAFALKNVTSRFAMERIKATTSYALPLFTA